MICARGSTKVFPNVHASQNAKYDAARTSLTLICWYKDLCISWSLKYNCLAALKPSCVLTHLCECPNYIYICCHDSADICFFCIKQQMFTLPNSIMKILPTFHNCSLYPKLYPRRLPKYYTTMFYSNRCGVPVAEWLTCYPKIAPTLYPNITPPHDPKISPHTLP